MMGYTEKDVGHWTFNKWNKLYGYFKKYHNFKIQDKLFDVPNVDSTGNEEETYESYEWFDD